jgi:hypothetical protein
VRPSKFGKSSHHCEINFTAARVVLAPFDSITFAATVMSTSTSELFTPTTIFSLLGVVAILVAAYAASALLLSKSARAVDRYIFIWLAFDALIHFIFEGSFLYYSTFGRTVFRGSGPFAELCKNQLQTLHTPGNHGRCLTMNPLFLFYREGVCQGGRPLGYG